MMLCVLVLWTGAFLQLGHAEMYTQYWAVRVRGGREAADRVAEKYGFTNMGQIGELKNYYSFRHHHTVKRSPVPNKEVAVSVSKETEVDWLQQQVIQTRIKRNSVLMWNTKPFPSSHLGSSRSVMMHLSDLMWNRLWYMRCSDESEGCRSHMNIVGAWSRGYTGEGVVLSVLDDGIEREHPDLKPNYDPLASYDVNGQDQDPSPRDYTNYHGTQCAGMVAAAATNPHCTVGVSSRARIGGIRMLDGDVTDSVEAQSLSFRRQHIDIYLASWGPKDDGKTLEGPGPLARLALQDGVKKGRNGRGSIFVWAAGNGGQTGDHCSCDGYSSSIYTISISSSSTRRGRQPDHLEPCSSTLATANTGGEADKMVVLGPKQSCSSAPSGTSFSSSAAAGVIALTLHANPSLTWRDMQHIIARTAQSHHLIAPDWHLNGAGYNVSHLYGFGLLDAERMVKEAEQWKEVPSQRVCEEEVPTQHSRMIHPGSTLTYVHKTTGCSNNPLHHVVFVEHVIVHLAIIHHRRGDLSITLTSPSGTVSQLLTNRPLDSSTEGFRNWEFMTIHCWGEQAAGEWTLKIHDTASQKRSVAEREMLKQWSLVIYGTTHHPDPMHRRRARSANTPMDNDVTKEYSGPCDPECGDEGCEGPSPQHCFMCLHFFLKFKNNTRMCVSECPRGFWEDRRRCKRCFSSCESCTGSRSDQCTSCQPGHHLTEGAGTCTATCEDSYYLDHDANICRKCTENCLKCTSYSICTECKPDASLQGNRCQRSCAVGFYHDEQEDTCKPCHKACATCAGAGAEACKHCAEGYLMEEWRCVPSCSAGFYATPPNSEIADGHRMCRRCDASCLTCMGPSRDNCSSCSGGHSLQEGVCVVNTVCTDGEYQDSNGKCLTCDATCLRCRGPQSKECISCVSSQILDEGHCVAECTEGKYQSGGQCHLCDHTCASCTDAGPTTCTSCDTDKFGIERYLYNGVCVDTCPEGFYHTKERSCESCSNYCSLCTSSSHCLRCNSSYYVSDGVCAKLECGEGEVEDPDYDECMTCEEGCRKCVLYNPRHCLSCTEGFYNFQDGCFKTCPAKTYSVDEEMTCVSCDEDCMSCDEDECYWCETDLFLADGRCVAECLDGFYGDEDTNECEECHPDCATCSGPEDGDCLSCEDEKMLQDGECVSDREVCPIKTFRSDDGECADCHPTCELCSGEEKSQCTACAGGRFLTTQQTCVPKCPLGFFGSRQSGVCEACPPGCSQCVDAERCTRCQSARKAPLYLQDGRCVQQCVRGYAVGQVCRRCAAGCASCWRNTTHCLSCDEFLLLHQHRCVDECPPGLSVQDGECRRCAPACEDCNPLGRCTACEEYHFLHEDQCVLECPESFFEDKDVCVCVPCHPECSLCDGPNNNDCDACADPDAVLHNGACLDPCPSHTYRDTLTGECKDCDASCLTCVGPHTGSCSSCREGHKLDSRGHCEPPINKCPSHHYADQDGECHPCHKYCQRCSGPSKNSCLSCNQGHLLLNGTCVDDCPPGYYEDERMHKCDTCHVSCQSCIGRHSHECLACRAHLFREQKECVETCQHSHYGNTVTMMCERCDPSCDECVAGGEDSCLSCAPGLVYLRREGRCWPLCPQGYYHDAVHRTCEPCHASCKTCAGKDSRTCDSCHPGYLLSQGMCESLCDINQYPLIKGLSHTCEDCDSSCLECRGPGPANCTVCPPQAILEAGGRRCLLCCRYEEEKEEEAALEKILTGGQVQHQDCCNCTETRGECILSTNLAFRNEEEEEVRGNLAVFITASILLVLGLGAVIFLIRHSRSKSTTPDIAPRGYEKLGSGGGYGAGSRRGYSSASTASYSGHSSSSGSRFQDSRLGDISDRRSERKNDEDDEDEDEDIVYMGKDGTVYRKFRYGQLGEDNEDELEYDDESYTFR
ncbi:proprotein convertase subtilisin/kexin type 5 [Thalassophryne amazonica]|uniref:proprotein convertase subtilisin/kexin type 5 n=1 Tax=Thalassophryne amazonica TaxID=390379 RepID=UPI001470F20F|nr:proprotein convertase subtilisin/kexin type 5 [Thalassophryne amazonica]